MSSYTPSNSPPTSDSEETPPPVGQVGQAQHVDDIEVVIENLGPDDVERLTTSSDSSGSVSMNTAASGGRNGANVNQEGVNGNGQGDPGREGAVSPPTAYERLQREQDELQANVRRNERRLADLLREHMGRAADNSRGTAPPRDPRPENQRGQGSPMPRHGHPVPPAPGGLSSARGRRQNLANEPQDAAEEVGGTENLNRSGTRVFQELKGKVDYEMETFENLWLQAGLRPTNRHLFLKSTKESLIKLKKEYMKSYQQLLTKKPSRELREEWAGHLTEGLEHIEVAKDDLSEKAKALGLDNTEESLSGISSFSNSQSGPDRWHGPRAPEVKMPLFTGNVADFGHWESLFDNIIGDRPDLKGAAKMSYLLGAVGPTVTKLIGRLGLTTSGYESARKLLRKKYGRADLLVATEITTLTDSPKAPEQEYSEWDNPMQDAITFAERVRDTADKLANKKHLGDIFLQIILKSKMPLWMYTDYDLKLNEEQTRRTSCDQPELSWPQKTDHLIAYVERRLATKMSVSQRGATSGYNQVAKRMIQSEKPEKPVKITTTAAFSTGVNEAGNKACVFCDKEGHKPELCPRLKTLSPADASKLCGNKKACKRCFKTGHSTADCHSGITCEKCSKDNHHTALHFNVSG